MQNVFITYGNGEAEEVVAPVAGGMSPARGGGAGRPASAARALKNAMGGGAGGGSTNGVALRESIAARGRAEAGNAVPQARGLVKDTKDPRVRASIAGGGGTPPRGR